MPEYPEQQDAQGIYLLELVRLVAGSSRFQERLGEKALAGDIAELFVYFPWIEGDPDNDKSRTTSRPFAVVEEGGLTWTDEGDGVLMPDGSLLLTLTDNAQYTDAPRRSYLDFRQFVGGVMQDIVDGIRTSGRDFPIVSIEQMQKPALSAPLRVETTPYWLAKYMFEWSSSA